MKLYVEIKNGNIGKLEVLEVNPSDQVLKVMIDHDFIKKSLPTASLDQVFEILKLTWSVTKIQETMASFQKKESD